MLIKTTREEMEAREKERRAYMRRPERRTHAIILKEENDPPCFREGLLRPPPRFPNAYEFEEEPFFAMVAMKYDMYFDGIMERQFVSEWRLVKREEIAWIRLSDEPADRDRERICYLASHGGVTVREHRYAPGLFEPHIVKEQNT